MKQWLTIFFHENPNETFENKFSYEQALGNYLTEIGKSDSNDPHFKRFKHACEAEQNKLNTARLTSNSIHSQEKRLSFIFFASVLILCTLIVYFQYPNPTSFLQYVPILSFHQLLGHNGGYLMTFCCIMQVKPDIPVQ